MQNTEQLLSILIFDLIVSKNQSQASAETLSCERSISCKNGCDLYIVGVTEKRRNRISASLRQPHQYYDVMFPRDSFMFVFHKPNNIYNVNRRNERTFESLGKHSLMRKACLILNELKFIILRRTLRKFYPDQ